MEESIQKKDRIVTLIILLSILVLSLLALAVTFYIPDNAITPEKTTTVIDKKENPLEEQLEPEPDQAPPATSVEVTPAPQTPEPTAEPVNPDSSNPSNQDTSTYSNLKNENFDER